MARAQPYLDALPPRRPADDSPDLGAIAVVLGLLIVFVALGLGL